MFVNWVARFKNCGRNFIISEPQNHSLFGSLRYDNLVGHVGYSEGIGIRTAQWSILTNDTPKIGFATVSGHTTGFESRISHEFLNFKREKCASPSLLPKAKEVILVCDFDHEDGAHTGQYNTRR